MKFNELADKFHDRANEIKSSSENNAKFRAMAYDRVAKKMYERKNETVTNSKIKALLLSKHMSNTANEWSKKTSSTTHKKPVNKSGSKSKSRSRNRSPSNTRANSKNPHKVSKKLTPSQTDKLIKDLSGFMGLGTAKSKKLIEDGLTHVNQLRQSKWKEKLPEETKAFMDLKPMRPIPHELIKKLEPRLKSLETKEMELYLVGSYRRGKNKSKDIDIMLVSENPDAIHEFMKLLKQEFDNKAYPYSMGSDKMSIIIAPDKVFKLDVFRVEPKHSIPMLLYSTGSKEHNIMMRGLAKRKGMLLNQKGLFKKEKTDDGVNLKLIKGLDKEEDYFNALGIKYKEPSERT